MVPKTRARTWLAWSLFALALTGLGFALDAWWPPQPRWVLPRGTGASFDLLGSLSADGKILTTYSVRPTKGGGIAYESVKAWDTINGRQRGEFRADSVPPRFSPLDALLQRQIETKDLAKPVNLKAALKYLSDKADGKLMFLFDLEKFFAQVGADAPDPYEEEVRLPPAPATMTLSTALARLLSQVGSGTVTFVVRRNFIEIMTTKQRFDEKILPPFARGTFVALAEQTEKGNKLHVVDAAGGKVVTSLSTHAGALNIWGFTPDKELLFFFATEQGKPLLSVWSTRARQVIQTFKDIDFPKFDFRVFTLAPDSTTMLAIQAGGAAELLNLRTGERIRLDFGMDLRWPHPVFSPDSKTLVALTKTELQVWDVPTGAKRRSIKADLDDPKSEWNGFCFSEDWSMCAGTSSTWDFKVWHLETGKCLWQRKGPEPHRDGSICCFLTQRRTDRIDILDFATGEAQAGLSLGKNYRLHLQNALFTPNGRSIVTSWQYEREPWLVEKWFGDRWRLNRPVDYLVVADAATGQIQWLHRSKPADPTIVHEEPAAPVQISDDGRTLVFCDYDKDEIVPTISCWDVPQRTPRLVVYGIPLALAAVAVLGRIWLRRKRGTLQSIAVSK